MVHGFGHSLALNPIRLASRIRQKKTVTVREILLGRLRDLFNLFSLVLIFVTFSYPVIVEFIV